MNMWPAILVLLGITAFYVFLSLYLVFHLLSGYLFGEKTKPHVPATRTVP